jgi:hypothetical protein
MIELDKARNDIQPIEPTLIYGLAAAAQTWKTLLEERPECVLPLDNTTRACFLHNHASVRIEQGVEGVSNILVPDKLDFFALLIGEDILLRLKFTGAGMPQNYPTPQQKALARQHFSEEVMQALPGLTAAPTLLTCGYTLDGVAIGRIEIRRDCIGHEPWAYDIYGGEAVAEPLVIPGMADITKPAIVTSTRRKAAEDERRAEQG